MTDPRPAPPGTVTTETERRTAAGHWLLASTRSISDAAAEWVRDGVTLLRPGILFGAVSIPAAVVHAAVGRDTPEACVDILTYAMQDGPMFYEPDRGGREDVYTALIPASAGLQWTLPGSVAHPYRALLAVPSPLRTSPGDQPDCPWWVVPVDGPAQLCSPDRLAALLAVGREALDARGGELR